MTDTNVNLDLSSNSKKTEDTFWNIVLIGLIIYIIYVIFLKDDKKNNNKNENFNSVKNEDVNRTKKIMHKIDRVDELFNQLEKKNPYPNLDDAPPYSDSNLLVQNLYEMNLNQNQNTPDVRSLDLMNKVGMENNSDMLDGEKISCNMLGINTSNMDQYKKNYYSMYAHQIECPSKCGLKANGMSKGCGMGSQCGLKMCKKCSGLNNLNTNTSIPDTFALNYLALDNANKKSCVTCNFKPKFEDANKLNREWMEQNYNDLPDDVKRADEERTQKKKLIDSNVSNYVNFENNTYQNSIGDTQVDKINELRACVNDNGTCKFSDYGNKISEVYDKLITNQAYSNRNNCDSYQLTGILEDSANTDSFQHF